MARAFRPQLSQVAELDNLLGFKGNYMMFPLKRHNYLTALLAAPHLDEFNAVRDADQLSTLSVIRLRAMRALIRRNSAHQVELARYIDEAIENKLAEDDREPDVVIVPTEMLHIEALPGDHPILEDFKLRHRKADAMKAEAEAIRQQALLLSGNYADPDVDRLVHVEGQLNVPIGNDE